MKDKSERPMYSQPAVTDTQGMDTDRKEKEMKVQYQYEMTYESFEVMEARRELETQEATR